MAAATSAHGLRCGACESEQAVRMHRVRCPADTWKRACWTHLTGGMRAGWTDVGDGIIGGSIGCEDTWALCSWRMLQHGPVGGRLRSVNPCTIA